MDYEQQATTSLNSGHKPYGHSSRCRLEILTDFSVGFRDLQIGKKVATGHFGNMKIPSFIIIRARKPLFVENIGPTVNGSCSESSCCFVSVQSIDS